MYELKAQKKKKKQNILSDTFITQKEKKKIWNKSQHRIKAVSTEKELVTM